MDNDGLSKSEFYMRRRMVELCMSIANEYDGIIEQEFIEDDFEDEAE
jgi:hypothetical protein